MLLEVSPNNAANNFFHGKFYNYWNNWLWVVDKTWWIHDHMDPSRFMSVN